MRTQPAITMMGLLAVMGLLLAMAWSFIQDHGLDAAEKLMLLLLCVALLILFIIQDKKP